MEIWRFTIFSSTDITESIINKIFSVFRLWLEIACGNQCVCVCVVCLMHQSVSQIECIWLHSVLIDVQCWEWVHFKCSHMLLCILSILAPLQFNFSPTTRSICLNLCKILLIHIRLHLYLIWIADIESGSDRIEIDKQSLSGIGNQIVNMKIDSQDRKWALSSIGNAWFCNN